jgi:hypothetical protein
MAAAADAGIVGLLNFSLPGPTERAISLSALAASAQVAQGRSPEDHIASSRRLSAR